MSPRQKRWQIAPRVSSNIVARFPNLNPLVVQILFNRGLVLTEQVDAFLAPDALVSTNPFQMRGMSQAVERLRAAIRAPEPEPIAVYGDFDVDGVAATALLVQTLEALGANVQPYIPHRIEEGYGLNRDALDQLKEKKVKVVVTVDCGIRSLDEIAYGKQIGLDMIVTDHHTPSADLPDAVAVIDPKQERCQYPFKELSGAGVAFKLAQALLRVEKNTPLKNAAPFSEDDLLDLVALGTVADLVPLTGENRALVKRGVEKLRVTERPGLRALIGEAQIKAENISAGTIGYVLGPRLNAAGRIDHALNAFHLLTTLYPAEVEELARKLEETNRERQRMTQELTQKARERVAPMAEQEHLLFVADAEFPQGIIGLIAGRLAEEFYRPTIAVHRGDEESRGSARSIAEFNLIAALDECKDLLVRHGGHAMAAGFTVRNENLAALEARIKTLARDALADSDLAPTIHVEAQVPLHEMTLAFLAKLQQLEPYGYGNREPVFVSRDVQVREKRIVGTDHLKMRLGDQAPFVDAIAFKQGSWMADLPSRIDVVYKLEANEWNGTVRAQLNVMDIKAAS